MSDSEKPMDPEQVMEKIISELVGLSLTVKILTGIILILIAAISFGMYLAYNNWDKIKKADRSDLSGSKQKSWFSAGFQLVFIRKVKVKPAF